MLFAAAIASSTSCGAFSGARASPLGISFALLPLTGGGGAVVESRPPLPANAVPGSARASAAAHPNEGRRGFGNAG